MDKYSLKLAVAFFGLAVVAVVMLPFVIAYHWWNYDHLEHSRFLRERGF